MLDGDDEVAACNSLLERKSDNVHDYASSVLLRKGKSDIRAEDLSSKRSKIITSSHYGHSLTVSNGRSERFIDDLTGQPLPPE